MPPTNVYGQSPHSSSDIPGSSEGTPDTRFTAFTPEETRTAKVVTQASTPLRASHQDPFVTTAAKVKSEQKLSATASAFKPFSQNAGNAYVIELRTSATAALPGMARQLKNLIDQTNSIHGSLQTKNAQLGSIKATSQGDDKNFGAFSTDTSATRCIQVIDIYKTDSQAHQTVMTSLQDFKKNGYKLAGSERVEEGTAAVFIRYSNIRDAAQVYTALKLDLPKYAVEYISPANFAVAVHSPQKFFCSAHEGQVMLTATYPTGTPYNKKAFEQGLIDLLSAEGDLFAWQKQAATEAGKFRMVVEYCDSTVAPRTVQRLHGQQIKSPQGDVTLYLELHTPDIPRPLKTSGQETTPTRRSSEQSSLSDTLGQFSLSSASSFSAPPEAFAGPGPSSPGFPYVTSNAAAFSLPPTPLPLVMGGMYGTPIGFPHAYPAGIQFQGHIIGSDFNTSLGHNNITIQNTRHENEFSPLGFQPQNYGQGFDHSNAHNRVGDYINRPSGRRQNAAKVHNHRRSNYNDHSAGQHNQVDIHRIKEGIDVRTTVMLRNIPNKVDQATLKQIVDESSFGRYDFMYLRIDFSNDCNVGYAFINFVDPLDIIDFVMARSNQKWHMFKSDKVAEVSYATIQGRDCLIQKFRNSSVMLEPPHYRPKLFFTIHDRGVGPVGEEEQFPPSDNSSKLRRSCENAEHVGLFAPSAGQHLRDEQRRRRSQFDRGTSLAEREEYYFDDGSKLCAYRGFFHN